jgi:hypothetical protein
MPASTNDLACSHRGRREDHDHASAERRGVAEDSQILTSTALRGFHATVTGISFGPYNTVFAVAGLLFMASGFASIAPLRTIALAKPERYR